MKIYVDESPAGAGKTHRAIESITSTSCKVLFITERIEMLKELETEIRRSAHRHRTAPIVRIVHGGKQGLGNSVARTIEELPSEYADYNHIIVLATHAAMLRADFNDFAGWQIIVDEVPQFLDFEQKLTPLDAAFFQRFYQLEPIGDNWSAVAPTSEGGKLTGAAVRADESHSHLAVFHRRVLDAARPGAERFVMCNLPDWQAMEQGKVQWCWASAFSLRELVAFDKLTLLGNRFRSDVGSILSDRLEAVPIEWIALPTLNGARPFSCRAVHINYFSETRTASRHLFSSAQGQVMLGEIGLYLSKRLVNCDYIWTANDAEGDSARKALESSGLSSSRHLTPRQAGSNAQAAISHAAIIYSAKPSPNLKSLLEMLKIPVELWTRSVEHETILQFVTRTSVRNPGNESPVHIWVFDREQARYLKDYFDCLTHAVATMARVEDGPTIPKQEVRGPKTMLRTPEEQKVYVEAKKARDKERKRRARAEAKLRKAA